MTLKEAVIEKLESLPTQRQQEVLDFAEFLGTKEQNGHPRRSLKGIWAGLNIDLTEEELRQARNEMWRGYTKDTEDEL